MPGRNSQGWNSSIVLDGTGIRSIFFVLPDYPGLCSNANSCKVLSVLICNEQNSMVFLNFLPEVIPGHYDFGMNRQEILREIYLWYSKRAVFSRFWDIWLLSKKPLRRRACNTQLALKKSSGQSFFCRFETLNFCYAIFSSVNLNGTCCTRRRYAYPGRIYRTMAS